MDINKTLQEYKLFLENKGYTVLYMGLYGSQNYNLSDENSDIDVKALVLPSARQLLTGAKVSKVYDVEYGQVEIKDVMEYARVAAKGNPAFLEIFHTEYWVGDEDLRELMQTIPTNKRAVLGMMHQKYEAIVKGLPRTNEYVMQGLYDPKQYHHIVRLETFLIFGADYNQPYLSYGASARDDMMNLKRKPTLSKEDAIADSYSILERCKGSLEDYVYEPKHITDELVELVLKYLKY